LPLPASVEAAVEVPRTLGSYVYAVGWYAFAVFGRGGIAIAF
jgi:hypothetical protein